MTTSSQSHVYSTEMNTLLFAHRASVFPWTCRTEISFGRSWLGLLEMVTTAMTMITAATGATDLM